MVCCPPGRVSLVLWIHTPTLRQCLGNGAKSRHILGILAILSQEQKTDLYALWRKYGILLPPLNHVQVVYHVHLTPDKKIYSICKWSISGGYITINNCSTCYWLIFPLCTLCSTLCYWYILVISVFPLNHSVLWHFILYFYLWKCLLSYMS